MVTVDCGLKASYPKSQRKEAMETYMRRETENRKTEYVTVSGCEAFLSYDDNSSIIVWNDGNYVYSINGDLCKNDIIEMANSVNPTK